MTVKRLFLRLQLLIVVLSLTGCAVLEKVLLVPEMDAEMPFNPSLTNKEVLDAITLAVKDVQVANPDARIYNENVTYFNVAEGVIETGHYGESNFTGMKLRAEIERDEHLIDITVKGTDIYYSKIIPLDKGLREIQMAITRRLAEAVVKDKK